MRIAVIGAAGRTGQHVVEQALAQGNDVIAVARNPERIPSRHDNLQTRSCDVRDRASLVEATKGVDAIVSALGTGGSREATDVYSAGVQSELDVMRQNGIKKLAVISAAPVGLRDEQPFLERRIAMPLLERLFGAVYDDMRRMESILNQSTPSWIALRPPRLVDKPATGSYRIEHQAASKGPQAHVSRSGHCPPRLPQARRPQWTGRVCRQLAAIAADTVATAVYPRSMSRERTIDRRKGARQMKKLTPKDGTFIAYDHARSWQAGRPRRWAFGHRGFGDAGAREVGDSMDVEQGIPVGPRRAARNGDGYADQYG